MKKKPKPTREETPRLRRRRMRQMMSWIGAVQEKWKKPMQKSMRETSGIVKCEMFK
jgi:hypothetical protein